MRRIALSLALAVLLVTAGCLGGVATPGASTGSDAGRDHTVEVGASGEASAEPDQAVVQVSVTATGPDAATARTRLAENVSRMREALREAGVPDDAVSTAYYDINRDHREKTDDAPRYRAVHAFRIVVDDLDRVGTVIDTAVDNGATGVDAVRFTLSTEKQRELREEALRDAMDNARSQAGVLASEANLTLTDVASVTTVETGGGHRVVEYAAASADSGTEVEPGSVTVTVSVVVTYNATASS